jgi:selenium metabolism protein YedF
MTCPIPVVETKKFLEKKPVDELEVILDNDVATENVTRFLSSQGFSVTSKKEGDGPRFILKGSRSASPGVPAPETETTSGVQPKRLLVYINSETIGVGSDELGRLLMNSFLHTLKELDVLPWRIVFINGGVKLAAGESEHVDILTEIVNLGTEVLSCGTCLDYFRLKDKVRVGKISNMHEISSSFLQATHVIRP